MEEFERNDVVVEEKKQANLNEPISLGKWVVYNLVSCIPCAGLIAMIVWACIEGPEDRQNWARGLIITRVIWTVVSVGLYFVFMFLAIKNGFSDAFNELQGLM